MALNEFSKGILGALSDVSRNQLQVGIAHVHRYIVATAKIGQESIWASRAESGETPAHALALIGAGDLPGLPP